MDVTFTAPDGKAVTVPAFWDGGDVWASATPRRESARTKTAPAAPNATEPSGLHGHLRRVKVRPYDGDNPLYKHGPIRIADDHRHFAYADGTPFFWLGDTWWMGLCDRLHWPDDFKALAADRREKGFNVIQIVAGLYPDMPAFDRARGPIAGQVSLGKRITAVSDPNTSTRRTSGCSTSPTRASRRASSGRGATTCRGWASRR